MKRAHKRFAILLGITGTSAALLLAQDAPARPGNLKIYLDPPGAHVSPVLYGMMTEEINHSYEGGLYGELIQNRNFGDAPGEAKHWSVVADTSARGALSLDETQPVEGTVLKRALKLDASRANVGHRVGIANEGYWGIPVKPNTTYQLSFYAKSDGIGNGPLTASIETKDGSSALASGQIPQITTHWQKYTMTLTSSADIASSLENRFMISTETPGTIWFNLVSLFPPTYNDRPNGNRMDLMKILGDMKPKFLRLPGGNYLEGATIADRFPWKQTCGPLDQRPGHLGCRGYGSSDGMGLLEMLEWCEDLHMQPVLAVYAGYSLEGQHVDAGPHLQPFVEDALDEIEYTTGDAHTPWGARRVKDGHPAPFPLQFVEIGNEDGFDHSGSYESRYHQFRDAIKNRFPHLQVIATENLAKSSPDLVDEHFYRSARNNAMDAGHYDHYSRSGPKIFVGEWASMEGSPTPNFEAALGDAAWLTGLERNSDIVVMESYAPLLTNVNPGASQWGTNLIGYNALTTFGSPSYYVQQMFSQNQGNRIIPVTLAQPYHPAPVSAPEMGAFGMGTWATAAEFKDIYVTNSKGSTVYGEDFLTNLSGWDCTGNQWAVSDGAAQ